VRRGFLFDGNTFTTIVDTFPGSTTTESFAVSVGTASTTACDVWQCVRRHRTVCHQSVMIITLEALITA
jgi:hypothetical protein